MFKKYYLAYGSNLNLKQMAYRCKTARPIGSVSLDNYRLVYKGYKDNYAYLTIEKCDGYSVPLGLFEVSFLDILALDKYEGYPSFYSKEYVDINMGGKKIKALIYVMKKDFDYHLPSFKYVQTCMDGYDCFEFDKAILDKALEDTKSLTKFKKKTKNIDK